MLEKLDPSESLCSVCLSSSLFLSFPFCPCLYPPHSLSLWCVSSAVPTPPVIPPFLPLSFSRCLFLLLYPSFQLFIGCEDCMAVSPDKPHFPFHRHRAAPHRVVMLRINLVRMSRCNRYGGGSDRLYSSLMLIVRVGGAVMQTLGCDSHHWSPNSSLTRGRAWSQSLHPTTSRLVASLPCGMSRFFNARSHHEQPSGA